MAHHRKGVWSTISGLSRRTLAGALCTALTLSVPAVASAAGPPSEAGKHRPRLGLVLSGGGARGAAHAGILKVLDELRIPVDVVTGTSMGALVGGLFATGKTPAEIEQILYDMDWGAAFKDTPPRNRLNYRRKTDEDGFLIKATIGVHDGRITIPKGAVQGQTITHLIRTLTLPAACARDFDDLPTPFRAVAADIVTGEEVVLGSGDLALAMRASMSLPGILVPVEWHGRTLVDGGITDNLPVDVARSMGVDRIIAVDISTPLFTKDELKSALDILNQVSTMLTRSTTEAQIATLTDEDVLIVPDLGDITSGDFDRAVDAVAAGEKAARAAVGKLRRFSVSPQEYARWKRLRARKVGCGRQPVVDEIEVDNTTRIADRAIMEHVHVKPGEPLDPNRLAEDLQDIYGLGMFDVTDYSLSEKDGHTVLKIKTRERSWGPGYLRFGLGLESNVGRVARFNLGVRYTRTLLNSLAGEYRVDLRVGSHPLVRFEWFQPLERGLKWFFSPAAQVDQNTFSVVSDGMELFTYRAREAFVTADAGRLLGQWGEVRLGLYSGTARGDLLVGIPILPHLKASLGGARGQFNVDTLDRLAFPRRGYQFSAVLDQALTGLGSDADYVVGTLRARGVWTRGRHTLVGTAMAGDTTLESATDGPISRFSLGGFLRLSGYFPDEFLGARAFFGSLNLRRQLNQASGIVSMPVYIGVSLETGNAVGIDQPLSGSLLHTAGSLYLGVDSFLGPIYVAAGWGEGGRNQFYFFLGQTF